MSGGDGPRRLRLRMDAVVTVVDAEALAAAARQAIAKVEFSDPSSDVDPAERARAAVRDSLADRAFGPSTWWTPSTCRA